MPPASLLLKKPERWDVPFDASMSEPDVDRLLTAVPFKNMDPAKFLPSLPLRGILQNDARIRKYRKGQLVVREGDYGTSVFMILSGALRVVISPGLEPSLLGRRQPRKKGILRQIAQLASFWKWPESRRGFELNPDPRLVSRQEQDGEVQVFLQGVDQILKNYQTVLRAPGEFIGEMAALTKMPRAFTVFAESDETELVEIRWQGFRDLKARDKTLKEHVDRVFRERVPDTLRFFPIFRHLSDEQLKKVAAQTEFQEFGKFEWSTEYKRMARESGTSRPEQEPIIAQEGDYANGVVVIRSGFARLCQKYGHGERTKSYLGTGSYFGFDEIAHNWRNKDAMVHLQHSLRAMGYTHVMVIPTRAIEEFVLPGLPKKLFPPKVSPKPTTERKGDAASRIGAEVLEFLAERRFHNGTATMLIDLDLCTRCDDCVRACASTHDNNPRFVRHGPTQGNVMVANACMHCVDPVCMIGCPTGAIHRTAVGGQVVINQATCIGCTICAENCPYNAIHMVEIRDTRGKLIRKEEDGTHVLKATKCDLCVEQHGGPACQRACPHGALTRSNLSDFDALSNWLNRS